MARAGTSGAVLAVVLASASAGAGDAIPWFDLTLLPAPVREPLLRYRRLACGAVRTPGLPLPDGVQLVFVSCHGGPFACPTGARDLGEYEYQFTCPAEPTARQIATMHLASPHPVPALTAFYREVLGRRFVELATDDAPEVTFVESAAAGGGFGWSPKRLHLALSETREPFAGAGYPAQIRITLSVNPPSEPRPVVRCRDFELGSPHDGSRDDPSRRWSDRYCWW